MAGGIIYSYEHFVNSIEPHLTRFVAESIKEKIESKITEIIQETMEEIYKELPTKIESRIERFYDHQSNGANVNVTINMSKEK